MAEEKMEAKTFLLRIDQLRAIQELHLEALGNHKETRTLTQAEVVRSIVDAGISALREAG